MKRFLCGLMAVGLFLGMAEQARSQPSYAFTTLDVPGSSSTRLCSANGINATGQIVGSYEDAAGRHSFLLAQGSFTRLDAPGAASTYAYGINGSGQIVGVYFEPPFVSH
jgi:probable HAF family extracellular repeat protein